MDDVQAAREALAAWGELGGEPWHRLRLVPFGKGLVNTTFAVGERHVLQRLHPVFGAGVHQDIAALSPWLRRAGVAVPELVRALDGQLCVEVDARIWRVLTRLPGEGPARVRDVGMARRAGAVLARLHGALIDVDHDFAFARPGAHDTGAHVVAMMAAVDAGGAHRLHAEVATAAEAVCRAVDGLGPEAALPARIGHGDPKIGNLLFDGEGRCTGVVDLDTFGWTTLEAELGDALRSWSRAEGGEDDVEGRVDLATWRAAMDGYASEAGRWLTEAELLAAARGSARIALELAARFLRDALEERYFGWDPGAAPGPGEHHLLRGLGSLRQGQRLSARRGALEADLVALWARRG